MKTKAVDVHGETVKKLVEQVDGSQGVIFSHGDYEDIKAIAKRSRDNDLARPKGHAKSMPLYEVPEAIMTEIRLRGVLQGIAPKDLNKFILKELRSGNYEAFRLSNKYR